MHSEAALQNLNGQSDTGTNACINDKLRPTLNNWKHAPIYLEPAFITDGFKNWKKAISKFQDHQLSICHREAMFKFKRHNTPGIGSQLNDQVKKSTSSQKRNVFETTVYFAHATKTRPCN